MQVNWVNHLFCDNSRRLKRGLLGEGARLLESSTKLLVVDDYSLDRASGLLESPEVVLV